MTDHSKAYWTQMHQKYSAKGLGVKPTKFAEEIIGYLPPSGTLLDLGAGQGQDSRFFAQHGFLVTSTDLTPHPLELSKTLAEQAGLTMTFQEVDMAKPLPFPDATFDVAYSHMALHYFDKVTTLKLFAEIDRVLKSGGLFATLLNCVDDPQLEERGFAELETDFYKTPAGIHKRYFSASSLCGFVEAHFASMLLDNQGKTYKDDIQTLIRFVGKKK